MHYMIVVEVEGLVSLGSIWIKGVAAAFLCVCEMSEPLVKDGCGHGEFTCEGACERKKGEGEEEKMVAFTQCFGKTVVGDRKMMIWFRGVGFL